MNVGKAIAIFLEINSDEYTSMEKGEAIYLVLGMPTHNSITKDGMLRVIQYLFDQCYDVAQDQD